MRLTLLGTGGPKPDPDRQGPAALVEDGDATVLVDCGRGVSTQLAKVGVSLADLSAVLVTHLHFDHVGDLGDVIMSAWNLGVQRLPIVGPPGTQEMVSAIFNDVYPLDIDYRLREDQFFEAGVVHPAQMITVTIVRGGETWSHGPLEITCEVVDHGDVLEMDDWTAVGYRFESSTASVAISGDAVPCEGLTQLARNADVLVQCCYLSEAEIDSDAARFLSERILGGAPQVVETLLKSKQNLM